MVAKVTIGVVLYRNKKQQIEDLLTSVEKNMHFIKLSGKKIHVQLSFYQNDSIRYSDMGLNAELIIGDGRNIGFGAAHNVLMKNAFAEDADFYVALNPDAVMKYDALFELLDAYFQHGGNCAIEARQFPIEHPKSYDQLSFAVDWISGFCFLMDRHIFYAVDGFDENMFLYCEDVDISWRIKNAGFNLRIAPKAVVFHEVTSRGSQPRNQLIHMHIAGRYLGQKWGSVAFSKYCEKVLADMGINSPSTSVTSFEYDSSRVTPNFSNGFSFSSVRF